MILFRTTRPVALAIVIALGLFAQNRPANATATEILTVAGGCFWCFEADFESVKGVKEAVSGFAGGTTENPTYKSVTSGGTGHYEAVQITFDPSVVTREALLSKFFRSVDPTDAGGQFCDRGPSYRTAVFTNTAAEKSSAESAKAEAQAALGKKVVTPNLKCQHILSSRCLPSGLLQREKDRHHAVWSEIPSQSLQSLSEGMRP